MTEAEAPAVEPLAYTIAEFCEAYRFGRTQYFQMKRRGLGPREMRVGRRVVISKEAAADWQRDREAAPPGRA